MIQIISILNKIRKIKPLHILIGLVIILLITCSILWNANRKKAAEIFRQSQNFEQLQEENIRQLTLTKKEFEQLNTTFKKKLDQVIKENDLKLRQVKAATVIQIAYKDTTPANVDHGTPVQIDNAANNEQLTAKIYKIPVSNQNQCWSFGGAILSTDKNAKLEIYERGAINGVQLIVTEKRRWIFWKRQKFSAFSDCGKIDVTKIDFVKK